MRLLAGICAAGSATRMGGIDKLTVPLTGSDDTLLGRAICAARPFACCVALPPPGHPFYSSRREVVADAPYVCVEDATDGLSASLRALAREAEGYDGLVVLLADMPDITAAHVTSLSRTFEAFGGQVAVRASTALGISGHPVIFPATSFAQLQALTGDTGARKVLEQSGVKPVALDGDAAIRDIDTPEALQAYLTPK